MRKYQFVLFSLFVTVSLSTVVFLGAKESAGETGDKDYEEIGGVFYNSGFRAGNGKQYAINAAVDGKKYDVIVSPVSVTRYRCLTKYDNSFQFFAGGNKEGEVLLSLQTDGKGLFCSVSSNLPAAVRISVAAEGEGGLAFRRLKYGDSTVYGPTALPAGLQCSCLDNMYIEGKSIYVKTGRISLLRDVGNGVKEVKKAGSGCRITNSGGRFSLEIPLTAEKNYTAATHFALCGAPLVKWDVGYVGKKAVNFDTGSQYHFLPDGLYNEKPVSYKPHPEPKRTYIYKSVAAWLLNSSSEPDCGGYFELISSYLLYSTIASYNSEGFIPTQPEADWVLSEYGIGRGFYDSRFNSDTVSALIYAYETHKDPQIKDTVRKALDFFLSFSSKNRFEINGSGYVPDYRAGNGGKSKASCSLNHYVTEALVLLKGSKLLGDDNYRNAGLDILNQIEKNYKMWLRDNGDLWYAVRQDGKTEKDDYVSVTYTDLVKAVGILSEYGIMPEYPGIYELLSSKEKWLKDNEYGKYVMPHKTL